MKVRCTDNNGVKAFLTLGKIYAGIQEEGESADHVACIFELHSYYENRPFLVEVKR